MADQPEQILKLLSDSLRENPDQIIGQNGLAVADWIDSFYFDEGDDILYRIDGYSRDETELVLRLRKSGINPRAFKDLVLFAAEKNITQEMFDRAIEDDRLQKIMEERTSEYEVFRDRGGTWMCDIGPQKDQQ